MFKKLSIYSSAAVIAAGLSGTFMTQAQAGSDCRVIRANTTASWYGPGFNGKRTASGDIFHESRLTAATRFLNPRARETIRVTNLKNGREVELIANDNGPFHGSRQIDVSKAAAQQLGMIRSGTARVRVEVCPS